MFPFNDTWWLIITDVSDLVGELQEIQNVTNTSTVAELLKQGAGEEKISFLPYVNNHCSSHFSPVEAA